MSADDNLLPEPLAAAYYAHSEEGKPVEEWHTLSEHRGTVPDLRTKRSGVVESGLSPTKENAQAAG